MAVVGTVQPAGKIYSEQQVNAAIIRMSRHIAWMFWIWIGIPLILAGIAVVMLSLALSGNS